MVSTVAYGGWRWQHHRHDADKVSVTDRIWIDHLPRGERDTFNAFLAIDDHAQGVFQRTTIWKGEFERFRFEISGGEMRILYPANGDKEKVRVKATECDEGGMDYCLQIDGASRGVKKYYSREGWEIGSVDEAEQRLQSLVE